MDTLQIAYEILNRLEHDDGTLRYKNQLVSPGALNVSPEKYINVMTDLQKKGYVDGFELKRDIWGDVYYDQKRLHITIDGCQYLKENSAFAKLRGLLSDVVAVTALK